jgi:hypothetical protein
MARPIRNVLTNMTELFLQNVYMYTLGVSWYNNDYLFKLTGQNVGRSSQSVSEKFLDLTTESPINSVLTLF